ncbi:non-homologous end-joining DNA ligase LigD [Rhizobium leguminosarum]
MAISRASSRRDNMAAAPSSSGIAAPGRRTAMLTRPTARAIGRGNTAVAPYSTRARPGAAVSMPLEWSELAADVGPRYFTVDNTPTRLDALSRGPWDGFFAAAKPLEKMKR